MWWPQFMAQLDSTYRATINAPTGKNEGLISYCKRLPSEYLKTNLFVGSSFMCHTEAVAAVRDGYYANCMWGSDYPHTEGTFQYPDSWDETPVTHIAQRFAYWDTPEEPLRAMLGVTAARVYGLDLDALSAVAARIVIRLAIRGCRRKASTCPGVIRGTAGAARCVGSPCPLVSPTSRSS